MLPKPNEIADLVLLWLDQRPYVGPCQTFMERPIQVPGLYYLTWASLAMESLSSLASGCRAHTHRAKITSY
jgi:hypothetical protein